MSKESRLRELTLMLGNNLYQLRRAKNLSLDEVASKTGLNYHTIRRIEIGDVKSLPKNSTLMLLADLYGADINKLFDPPSQPIIQQEPALHIINQDETTFHRLEKTLKDLGVAEDRIRQLEVKIKELELELKKKS